MGLISSAAYAPRIQFTEGRKGPASHKRLKIQNLEKSIAFKTEREMRFFNKRHYVPLCAKDDKGHLVKVYVNVNSLANNTGLTKEQIKSESKSGHLEALVESHSSKTDLVVEKNKQSVARRPLEEKLQQLRGMDPSISKGTLKKMVDTLIELENSEVNGVPYLEHLQSLFEKDGEGVPLEKRLTGLPYSLEYHGKNQQGEPILLIKYNSNFAKGKFKSSTKALDFYSARVLVKSKIVVSEDGLDEIEGYRNMDGVRGALNLILVMKYHKRGFPKAAVYTDYKNIGDLVKVKKGLFGRLDAKLADVKREQQKEVLLCGLYNLLETLEQIHAKDIVHRDVKVTNIFLHKNREGKFEFFLGDPGFSSSKDKQEDYNRGSIPVPELFNLNYPRAPFTEKVDIYALGYSFDAVFREQFRASKSSNGKGELQEWERQQLRTLFQHMRDANPDTRYSATQAKEELKVILISMGINPVNNRYVSRAS